MPNPIKIKDAGIKNKAKTNIPWNLKLILYVLCHSVIKKPTMMRLMPVQRDLARF